MTEPAHHEDPSNPPLRSRRWGTALAIILLLVLVRLLGQVLLPFVFAAAIAWVVEPAVKWLTTRLHGMRWLAATIVFMALLALLGGLGFWAHLVVVPQVIELGHDAPQLIRQLFQKVFGSERANLFGHEIDANVIAQGAINSLFNRIGGPGGALAGLVVILVMTFLALTLLLFLLISGPKLARGTLWLVPPGVRPQVRTVVRKMRPVLYRYVAGVIGVVIVASILCWIGTSLFLGLPNAVVLSIVVGLLEIVPVVGPTASAGLLALIAVTTGKLSVIIGVALFALALRLSIDQVLGPLIIGRAVKLHPVVIIFAFLVGWTLFGMLGVLLAVPAAATIKISLDTFYEEATRDSGVRNKSTRASE